MTNQKESNQTLPPDLNDITLATQENVGAVNKAYKALYKTAQGYLARIKELEDEAKTKKPSFKKQTSTSTKKNKKS